MLDAYRAHAPTFHADLVEVTHPTAVDSSTRAVVEEPVAEFAFAPDRPMSPTPRRQPVRAGPRTDLAAATSGRCL